MTIRTNAGVYIALGILLVLLVGSSLVTVSRSQGLGSFPAIPSRSIGQKESTLTQQVSEQEIPSVYYRRQTQVGTQELEPDAARRAKSARYEKRLVVRDTDTGGKPILTFSHWDDALPALPVGRSGLVAFGEVVDARAYLSNDQTGVYSEFTIRIERLFLNDKSSVVSPGELITAERWGGRVIFPSGRVIAYGNRGQGVPKLGRQYVFFLERNPEQYNILTAYQLLSGQVEPLDGKSAPGGEGSEWGGNAYKGIAIDQFLRDVESAVGKGLAPDARGLAATSPVDSRPTDDARRLA